MSSMPSFPVSFAYIVSRRSGWLGREDGVCLIVDYVDPSRRSIVCLRRGDTVIPRDILLPSSFWVFMALSSSTNVHKMYGTKLHHEDIEPNGAETDRICQRRRFQTLLDEDAWRITFCDQNIHKSMRGVLISPPTGTVFKSFKADPEKGAWLTSTKWESSIQIPRVDGCYVTLEGHRTSLRCGGFPTSLVENYSYAFDDYITILGALTHLKNYD